MNVRKSSLSPFSVSQINSYKKLKSLFEKWVDLALEYSKLEIDLDNKNQLK